MTFYRPDSGYDARSLTKLEQQAINATRSKLGAEKLPEKPVAKVVSKSIDVQEEFAEADKVKLEMQAKNDEIARLRMDEQNLTEYQQKRVRALTKIMNEVVKDGPDLKRDRKQGETIAQLFGLDQVVDKGKILGLIVYKWLL